MPKENCLWKDTVEVTTCRYPSTHIESKSEEDNCDATKTSRAAFKRPKQQKHGDTIQEMYDAYFIAKLQNEYI